MRSTTADTMGRPENLERENVEVRLAKDDGLKFICKDGVVCRTAADLSKRLL